MGKPKRPGAAARLAEWIERERPREIGEAEWEALKSWLHPVSESYLRRLLRASGAPLAPLIAGVRQETPDALEASLLQLLPEYLGADPARRSAIRKLVIEAKEHARFAARRAVKHAEAAKRAEKEEMVLWMTVWLENPPLFPEWVRLRRAVPPGNS